MKLRGVGPLKPPPKYPFRVRIPQVYCKDCGVVTWDGKEFCVKHSDVCDYASVVLERIAVMELAGLPLLDEGAA